MPSASLRRSPRRSANRPRSAPGRVSTSPVVYHSARSSFSPTSASPRRPRSAPARMNHIPNEQVTATIYKQMTPAQQLRYRRTVKISQWPKNARTSNALILAVLMSLVGPVSAFEPFTIAGTAAAIAAAVAAVFWHIKQLLEQFMKFCPPWLFAVIVFGYFGNWAAHYTNRERKRKANATEAQAKRQHDAKEAQAKRQHDLKLAAQQQTMMLRMIWYQARRPHGADDHVFPPELQDAPNVFALPPPANRPRIMAPPQRQASPPRNRGGQAPPRLNNANAALIAGIAAAPPGMRGVHHRRR